MDAVPLIQKLDPSKQNIIKKVMKRIPTITIAKAQFKGTSTIRT